MGYEDSMKIQVWHADPPNFMADTTVALKFAEGFRHVADVEVADAGDAFRVTNHIDAPWTDNPEVTMLVPPQVRSTSVGDVFVLPNGRRLMLDGIGHWEF
jgi:hypothetical protein